MTSPPIEDNIQPHREKPTDCTTRPPPEVETKSENCLTEPLMEEKALRYFKFSRKPEEIPKKEVETQSPKIAHVRIRKKKEEDDRTKLHSKRKTSTPKKTPGKVQKRRGGSQNKKKNLKKKSQKLI